MEFEELSESEQAEALQQMSLLCRVEPSHKQRLVEMLKAQVRRSRIGFRGLYPKPNSLNSVQRSTSSASWRCSRRR